MDEDGNVIDAISIHAPHARSDLQSSQRDTQHSISIHAPHARSDLVSLHWTYPDIHFNPRSSCEERRVALTATLMLWANFNPRSSCEERRGTKTTDMIESKFQSTLLMRGATTGLSFGQAIEAIFQSTLLMRGATYRLAFAIDLGLLISIHAPHARSDAHLLAAVVLVVIFQSTLLMRGATIVDGR